MSTISQESISQLSEVQEQIWQGTANAATQGFGVPVAFTNPLTVVARAQDVVAELPGPMLALRFAFKVRPADEQLILLTPEFGKEVISQLVGMPVDDLDDEVLASAKAAFETIVRGLSDGCSKLSNEVAEIASFTLQRQIVELPRNLQDLQDLVRVQLSASVGKQNGTFIWLFSEAAGNTLLRTAFLAEAAPVAEPAPTKISTELDVILDIPLQVSVELGRMSMLVQDVVELGTGSVIEIDKAAGDPVDVLVNGKLVARGEVVVIEDNFGVRITEILTPKERVNKLGEAA